MQIRPIRVQNQPENPQIFSISPPKKFISPFFPHFILFFHFFLLYLPRNIGGC